MNLNPTEMGAVSATITDQNNNAVSNAFIRGLNLYKIKYHDPGPFDDELVKNWIYTFSDDTGYFKLIPYTENLINDYRIFIVSGSATGTEKFAYGNNETQVTIPSSIIIDRVKFEFDDIFNEIVPFGVDKNFKAWNSIKINSEILGQSTIRAREEINLTNGFHAFTNSEVHIF
nr:hypothetical protein [Bacteroidia bacterium]